MNKCTYLSYFGNLLMLYHIYHIYGGFYFGVGIKFCQLNILFKHSLENYLLHLEGNFYLCIIIKCGVCLKF